MPVAGLFYAAAIKRSQMPWRVIWKILAGTLKPIMKLQSFHKPASFSPTSLPGNFFASQALNCPCITASAWNVSAMAPALSRLTMLSERLFRGLLPNARELRPFTLGARLKRSSNRSELLPPSGPSFFLVNHRSLTRVEPRLASIPSGPTAMYLTEARKTIPNPSKTRSHVLLRISEIAFWPDPSPHPQHLSDGTQTWLEATSWEVSWISVRFSSVLRPRFIALPSLIFICVEHRLPLVAVSTEWPVIMPPPQRLRIRLANLQLVKLFLQTGQLWCLV